MKATSWLWVKVTGLSFSGREVNLDYVNSEFRIVVNALRSHRPRFLKRLYRFIHFKEKKAMESSDQMCPGSMKKHETKDWSHIISIWVSDLADSRALHLHYCSRSILKFSVLYSKLQPIHIFVKTLNWSWWHMIRSLKPNICDCSKMYSFGIVQIKALYNREIFNILLPS